MNYEEKYKEALETVQEILDSGSDSIKMLRLRLRLQSVFPELKESEDERIRKALITFFNRFPYDSIENAGINAKETIAWLEKQRDQEEPQVYETEDCEIITYSETDGYKVVERKFKVGDYIANDYCKGKVIELSADAYLLDTGQGIPFSCEHNAHLWSIDDAKDGDVLVNDEGKPFIFKGLLDAKHPNCPVAYGGVCINCDDVDEFCISERYHWWCDLIGVKPATKEERDFLFQKMHEKGYEFNFEKKELKKN